MSHKFFIYFPIILFMSIASILLQPYDIYNRQSSIYLQTLSIQNETQIIEIKPTETISTHVNCSNSWKTKHKQNNYLYHLFGEYIPCTYKWRQIPKGTFTWWLSHIDSQNRIIHKSLFADKFLMKQYIINYTKTYPSFNQIQHAKILWDFTKDGKPSCEQLKNLKRKHQTFLVKPSHTSAKQIFVSANDGFSRQSCYEINKQSQKWLLKEHKRGVGRAKREPWYPLIPPRVFIEENINKDPINYPLIEYKINVFNYKALFLYVYTHTEKMSNLNMYTLPDFKWLNVTWCKKSNKTHIDPIPKNLDTMIKFSEHFARKEQWNYVRVDLYEMNNTIYFSEFTFAPTGGVAIFAPLEFDYLLYDILCENKLTDYEKIYEYT